MASIEYITKRIEGKEKEIAKLEKKLSRIEKAEATGWEVNPYYYSDYDKRYTVRDLDAAREALEKYKAELNAANEKENSRNVEAILKFLENWKDHVRKFYVSMFPKYETALAEWYAKDSEYCDWWNHGGRRNATADERKRVEEEHDKARSDFYNGWAFIQPYIEGKRNRATGKYEMNLNMEKLNKELNEDAKAKYDDIIERTNKITGKILDASALSVGEKGELNGYIKGERGTAKVHTIGAGGYNIQCFHFRTLVNELR